MELDTHTSAQAEAWANVVASRGKLEPSPDSPDGENLFYECGRDSNPSKDAVLNWCVAIHFFLRSSLLVHLIPVAVFKKLSKSPLLEIVVFHYAAQELYTGYIRVLLTKFVFLPT